MVEVTAIPKIELHDGVEIPQFGFGVFQVPPDDTRAVVEDALEAGYRHIDTAGAYRNEKGVGEALAASGIPREEVFVTTKLWNYQQGYDSALAGVRGQPRPPRPRPRRPLPDPLADADRRTSSSTPGGPSNGSSGRAEPLDRRLQLQHRRPRAARARDRDPPTINQVELHPASSRPSCAAGTPSTASRPRPGARSPRAGTRRRDDRADRRRARKTPAQAILRWHIQLGNIVFPKSVTPERIRENIDIFDFELTEAEMATFAGLDSGERTGPDPATFVRP